MSDNRGESVAALRNTMRERITELEAQLASEQRTAADCALAWNQRVEDLEAQLVDTAGLEEGYREIKDAFLLSEDRIKEVEAQLAQVQKQHNEAMANAVRILTIGACEKHQHHIRAIDFPTFYAEEQALGCVYCTHEQLVQAQAEIEKLRGALRKIVETEPAHTDTCPTGRGYELCLHCEDMIEIARAALREP